jgi:cytochrome c peroxidase
MKLLIPSLLLCAILACTQEKPVPPASAPVATAPTSAPVAPAHAKAAYAPRLKNPPSVVTLTELGRALFFDPSLSASGHMSCATCHSPAHAFGPPNDLAVQEGGANMKIPGTRAVPSLRYLQTVPSFTEHFHEDDGDDSVDAGPTGGLTWDGRVNSAHEQALIPLLAKNEMANTSPAAVAAKLQQGSYAAKFRAAFGDDVFNDPDAALHWALMALETFQQSPPDFYPYDSKYDAYLRHQVSLSKAEARGLALFDDKTRGNCAACHASKVTSGGAFPQFTDYGFIAVGVPRNAAIPANDDATYYDLGLCGPSRTDFKNKADYCGLFRTPSLRNVATRTSFFHNGKFHNLQQVLEFYAERDTRPEKWYPNHDGAARKFDDLPPAYHQNVNLEPPFNRKKGDRPIWNAAEIADVLAFLKTLNDGYRP